VVAGDDDERDSCCVESFEGFENGRVGFGLRFHHIEEVAGVDQGVGFLLNNTIHTGKEILVDLFFPEIHPGFWIEP
jgi:hypothetical protein